MSAPLLVPVLGAAAAALATWPVATRARRRARQLQGPDERHRHRIRLHLVGWAEMMGRHVRRVARRPADVSADRRLGATLVLGPLGAVVHPMLGLVAAGLPYARHLVVARRGRRDRARASVRELPDAVDLFRIAVGGGLTVRHAVDAVRTVSDGPIERALGAVVRRVSYGERLADALPSLIDELGEAARPLVAVLVSAERDGAPLREPLERVAWVTRDVRRRHAEEAARRVPVQLLFPLVVCVLPAFAVLTVVPLLAGTLRTLSL